MSLCANEGSIATRRRAFEASSTHDAWSELAGIRAPSLVVHGSGDTITPPQNGRALASAIPGAEYLEPSGGRHAPHLGQPEAVDAIIDFISRHPLPSA
ncbi:alpha/beta fold hydrolase [Microbacterium sp. 179-B 1A2 NHS]|uniref:alpha/beta fold hydrolase n=1 Tax=Microbacterium sp. 179-B 1A2 NHS TaxID=3142383 RepID=UPI0039A168FD